MVIQESKNKRYLFFFVHPAKVHLFKYAINQLIMDGQEVEIIITGRDILEELVKHEGWKYKKIFSKGRKLKWAHTWISAGLFLFATLWKLWWLTLPKRYELFVTDDLLTFIGRIRGIKTIFVTDDDLSAVPESVILMISAHFIFAPSICELGRYNKKKIGYRGFKSLCHLHPNHFTPNVDSLPSGFKPGSYVLIRTVKAISTHDIGKRGISDSLLKIILNHIGSRKRIIINSERQIGEEFSNYQSAIDKTKMSDLIANCCLFISDSTTMCAEAAVLGIPSIEIDDWFNDFKQYQELSEKYQLLSGYCPDNLQEILDAIDEILNNPDSRSVYTERREKMLSEKIDVSSFLYWLVSESPTSFSRYFANPDFQFSFK